jgi:hypothetical protein
LTNTAILTALGTNSCRRANQLIREKIDPCQVSAWPGEAGNKTKRLGLLRRQRRSGSLWLQLWLQAQQNYRLV